MHRRVKLFCNGIKFVKRQGVPEKHPAFCCVGNKGLADQKQTQTAGGDVANCRQEESVCMAYVSFPYGSIPCNVGPVADFFYKIEDYARPGFVITNSQVWLC